MFQAHSLILSFEINVKRNVKDENLVTSDLCSSWCPLSVDGDSCLQPDKPLHSVPGPITQHLLRLLADDMGAGLLYGGHANDTGWKGPGR